MQNADDNKYGRGVSCPVLELVLTGGAVSLLNNELGFRLRDVRGIADIGKSKKKGKAGYTGETAQANMLRQFLLRLQVTASNETPQTLVVLQNTILMLSTNKSVHSAQLHLFLIHTSQSHALFRCHPECAVQCHALP